MNLYLPDRDDLLFPFIFFDPAYLTLPGYQVVAGPRSWANCNWVLGIGSYIYKQHYHIL